MPRPAAEVSGEMRDPAPLDAGLERSRGGFVARLRGLLGGPANAITPEAWQEVEEALIAGDVGATLALEVVDRARARASRDGSLGPVDAVRAELEAILATATADADAAAEPRAHAGESRSDRPDRPHVVLVVGVNGTGKTTTIGKLAFQEHAAGRRVILAAADTFRAAAVEQLRIWAARSHADVVAHAPGADPAAVVFDALDAAVARGADSVIVDTAGRLHTKANLMDELTKVRRIVNRRLPDATPETLFVLDATTGQNGLAQAVAFHDAVGLTGIVLTKLDSTARGGIVFAIVDRLGVPIVDVGVGERAEDLVPFDPGAFVDALFGPVEARA